MANLMGEMKGQLNEMRVMMEGIQTHTRPSEFNFLPMPSRLKDEQEQFDSRILSPTTPQDFRRGREHYEEQREHTDSSRRLRRDSAADQLREGDEERDRERRVLMELLQKARKKR